MKIKRAKTLILTENQAKRILSKNLLLEDRKGSVRKATKKLIRDYFESKSTGGRYGDAFRQIRDQLDTPILNLTGFPREVAFQAESTAMFQTTIHAKPIINKEGQEVAENRLIDLFRSLIFDQLCLRRTGPWKYGEGAVRILLFELGYLSMGENTRGGDIIKFAKTLQYITFFPDFFLNDISLDNQLNGMGYREFMSIFAPKMREFYNNQVTACNNIPSIHTHGYTITRIDDRLGNGGFDLTEKGNRQLDEIAPYTDWCICGGNRGFEYKSYTTGAGAVYVMAKDGFKNIQKPEDIDDSQADERPLDEYGLSLVCVIVGADGLPDLITTRYNHSYSGENNLNFFIPEQIKKRTGVDFFSVFKPRSREELRQAHIEIDENTNKKKIILTENQLKSLRSAIKEDSNKKKAFPVTKVNAGIMDAVTAGGTMEEGADPESDDYTIGSEGGNNEYFHVNETEEKEKDLRKYFKPIAEFMQEDGLNVSPFPEVKLNWDEQDGLFIKTGYYEPESKTITIFCADRHPKDILRTFAHEMIHHSQNLDGVDLNFSSDDDVKDNERLEEIEAEAYLKGNVYFRKWTEYENKQTDVLQEGKITEDTDPEDIDLSSFDIKTALNPKFWKDGHLDSRIRMKLLDIADDFVEFIGVDWVKPEDVIMTGSLANFNWNKKFSDIDLHVVMDFSKVDKRKDFVKEYFNSKKQLWNDSHKDLKIFGFPIEVYVQDKSEKHSSTGVYSIDKDKWIEKPERKKLKDTKINKSYIKKKVAEYADIVDELSDNYDNAKGDYDLRKVLEKAEKLFKDIKAERTSGLNSSDNEISNGNIIYKSLRRMGKIDKIFDIEDDCYNKLNSLCEGRELLKEDQEGDSMKKARRYLVAVHGYSEEEASEIVRIKVRQEFSTLHGNSVAGKFILGLTRLLFDENLDKGTKSKLDTILRIITRDESLYKSFDKNLNGLSAVELIGKFSDILRSEEENNELKADEQSKKQQRAKNYTIVKIDSFEEANKYSQYTNFGNNNGHWCLTHMPSMYNSYTSHGVNQIYFCLRDGFENLRPKQGENCPLDDFGLSMLCVIVDKAGNLLHVTSRWNHLNGGGDNVMNETQLCSLLGVDFYSTFPPSNKIRKIARDQIDKLYNTNEPIGNIFDKQMIAWNGNDEKWFIVKSDDFYNIAVVSQAGRRLLFDGWFDYAQICPLGVVVKRNGLYNIVRPLTHGLVSKRWFKTFSFSSNGFATVRDANRPKYNIIKSDGSFLFSEWLDMASIFRGDYPCIIGKNDKFNIIDENGNLISKIWFDGISEFEDGLAPVKMYEENGAKFNYIDKNGNLLLNHWADYCKTPEYGISVVTYYKVDIRGDEYPALYAINFADGGRLLNRKNVEFDDIRPAYYGDILIVEKNRKYNLLLDDKILINTWVDDIETFYNSTRYNRTASYAQVELDGKFNFVKADGQFIFDDWYDSVWKEMWTPDGLIFGVEKKELGANLATYDGELLFNEWFSRVALKLYDFGVFAVIEKYIENVPQYNVISMSNKQYILPFYVSDINAIRDGAIMFSIKDMNGYDARYTYWYKSGLVYLLDVYFEDEFTKKKGTPINDFIEFCHENGLRIKMVNEG